MPFQRLHLPKTSLGHLSFSCFSGLEGSATNPRTLARSLNLNLGRIRANAVCVYSFPLGLQMLLAQLEFIG